MRIGILTHSFAWGGGQFILRLMLEGLALDRKKSAYEFVFFVEPKKRNMKNLWGLGDKKENPVLKNLSELDLAYKVIGVNNNNKDLAASAKRAGVDVLLPAISSLGDDFPLPWIGYIFDFQHKYFPDYFSKEDRDHRDKNFEKLVNTAPAVVMNAKQVAKDIETFFPSHSAKLFPFPFAANPQREWLEADVDEVKKRYNLSSPFFIISNQFWIHKSHLTAFKALGKISDKSIDIVCTGETSDHRFPNYFKELMAEVKKMGLEKRVHVLGFIPKLDQLALVRGSVAAVQPTLFEGGPGGGIGFEAIAMGVSIIMSDIAVNREIKNEPGTFYFEKKNEKDLAKKMQAVLSSPPKRPSNKKLESEGKRRLERLAKTLNQAIEVAINA